MKHLFIFTILLGLQICEDVSPPQIKELPTKVLYFIEGENQISVDNYDLYYLQQQEMNSTIYMNPKGLFKAEITNGFKKGSVFTSKIDEILLDEKNRELYNYRIRQIDKFLWFESFSSPDPQLEIINFNIFKLKDPSDLAKTEVILMNNPNAPGSHIRKSCVIESLANGNVVDILGKEGEGAYKICFCTSDKIIAEPLMFNMYIQAQAIYEVRFGGSSIGLGEWDPSVRKIPYTIIKLPVSLFSNSPPEKPNPNPKVIAPYTVLLNIFPQIDDDLIHYYKYKGLIMYSRFMRSRSINRDIPASLESEGAYLDISSKYLIREIIIFQGKLMIIKCYKINPEKMGQDPIEMNQQSLIILLDKESLLRGTGYKLEKDKKLHFLEKTRECIQYKKDSFETCFDDVIEGDIMKPFVSRQSKEFLTVGRVNEGSIIKFITYKWNNKMKSFDTISSVFIDPSNGANSSGMDKFTISLLELDTILSDSIVLLFWKIAIKEKDKKINEAQYIESVDIIGGGMNNFLQRRNIHIEYYSRKTNTKSHSIAWFFDDNSKILYRRTNLELQIILIENPTIKFILDGVNKDGSIKDGKSETLKLPTSENITLYYSTYMHPQAISQTQTRQTIYAQKYTLYFEPKLPLGSYFPSEGQTGTLEKLLPSGYKMVYDLKDFIQGSFLSISEKGENEVVFENFEPYSYELMSDTSKVERVLVFQSVDTSDSKNADRITILTSSQRNNSLFWGERAAGSDGNVTINNNISLTDFRKIDNGFIFSETQYMICIDEMSYRISTNEEKQTPILWGGKNGNSNFCTKIRVDYIDDSVICYFQNEKRFFIKYIDSSNASQTEELHIKSFNGVLIERSSDFKIEVHNVLIFDNKPNHFMIIYSKDQFNNLNMDTLYVSIFQIAKSHRYYVIQKSFDKPIKTQFRRVGLVDITAAQDKIFMMANEGSKYIFSVYELDDKYTPVLSKNLTLPENIILEAETKMVVGKINDNKKVLLSSTDNMMELINYKYHIGLEVKVRSVVNEVVSYTSQLCIINPLETGINMFSLIRIPSSYKMLAVGPMYVSKGPIEEIKFVVIAQKDTLEESQKNKIDMKSKEEHIKDGEEQVKDGNTKLYLFITNGLFSKLHFEVVRKPIDILRNRTSKVEKVYDFNFKIDTAVLSNNTYNYFLQERTYRRNSIKQNVKLSFQKWNSVLASKNPKKASLVPKKDSHKDFFNLSISSIGNIFRIEDFKKENGNSMNTLFKLDPRTFTDANIHNVEGNVESIEEDALKLVMINPMFQGINTMWRWNTNKLHKDCSLIGKNARIYSTCKVQLSEDSRVQDGCTEEQIVDDLQFDQARLSQGSRVIIVSPSQIARYEGSGKCFIIDLPPQNDKKSDVQVVSDVVLKDGYLFRFFGTSENSAKVFQIEVFDVSKFIHGSDSDGLDKPYKTITVENSSFEHGMTKVKIESFEKNKFLIITESFSKLFKVFVARDVIYIELDPENTLCKIVYSEKVMSHGINHLFWSTSKDYILLLFQLKGELKSQGTEVYKLTVIEVRSSRNGAINFKEVNKALIINLGEYLEEERHYAFGMKLVASNDLISSNKALGIDTTKESLRSFIVLSMPQGNDYLLLFPTDLSKLREMNKELSLSEFEVISISNPFIGFEPVSLSSFYSIKRDLYTKVLIFPTLTVFILHRLDLKYLGIKVGVDKNLIQVHSLTRPEDAIPATIFESVPLSSISAIEMIPNFQKNATSKYEHKIIFWANSTVREFLFTNYISIYLRTTSVASRVLTAYIIGSHRELLRLYIHLDSSFKWSTFILDIIRTISILLVAILCTIILMILKAYMHSMDKRKVEKKSKRMKYILNIGKNFFSKNKVAPVQESLEEYGTDWTDDEEESEARDRQQQRINSKRGSKVRSDVSN